MANEIYIDYPSGSTLYAVVRNRPGQVWYIAGKVFETWGSSGHGADDYDIALTDKGGSRYVGSFDSNIPAGTYSVQVFAQAGVGPSDEDSLIGGGEIIWTGVGELTCGKILANKAVQSKVTGAITYYDDDGETELVTLSPSDTAASLIRTPG